MNGNLNNAPRFSWLLSTSGNIDSDSVNDKNWESNNIAQFTRRKDML